MAFGDKIENSMAAPVKERWATCAMCDKGRVLMDDPREFKAWLRNKAYIEKLSHEEVKRIKREWKQSGGYVPCEHCRDSSGQVLVFV